MAMNYDSNIGFSVQTVRLTYALWTYTATLEVSVRGNLKGGDIFDAALEVAYAGLCKTSEAGIARLKMLSPEGGSLNLEDDDDGCEDWLKRICIGFEITSIRPE